MNRTPPACRSGYRNSDHAHLLPSRLQLQSTSTQARLSKEFVLLSSFFAGLPRYRRFTAYHWLKRPIAQGRRDWLASGAVTGSVCRDQWVIDCAHTTLHNHKKYNVSRKEYKIAGAAVVAGSALLRNLSLKILMVSVDLKQH